jgi:hypothetical protein
MVAAPQVGHRLSSVQFYILAAIPLVGILANTGLCMHLSSTMKTRFATPVSRFKRGGFRRGSLCLADFVMERVWEPLDGSGASDVDVE